MSESTPAPSARPRRFRLVALFALLAVGALFVGSAVAGPGFGAGGHCGDRLGADATEAQVRARMDRAAEFVLNRVDATDDQRKQVSALLDDAAPRVLEARQESQARREAFRAALTAEQVDVAALEGLRTELLADAGELSGEGLDLLVDLAEVLTPEQRAELAETWDRFHR